MIGDACKVKDERLTIIDASRARKYDLQLRKSTSSEDDYIDAPNFADLSQLKVSAIPTWQDMLGKWFKKD